MAKNRSSANQDRNLAGRRLSTVALLAAAAVLLAFLPACGSRLSRDEILAQNRIGATGLASTSDGGGVIDSGEVEAGDIGGVSTGAGSGDVAGGGPVVEGTGSAARPTEAGRGPASAAAGSAAAGPAQGEQAQTATKAPIVVGVVGWLTGLGGISTAPAAEVVGAWSRWVNANGGIKGHPVKLYVADDGGDSARSVAIAKDFVENKGAIALISYLGAQADAVAEYAKSKNVPVIGGANIDPVWTKNPMMFATGAGVISKSWGLAKRAQEAGAKRVALMYCAEVAGCKVQNDQVAKFARELGLEVVYETQVSLAQPDFTAECVQARDRRAEAFIPTTDINSVTRIAQSCGRQGYRPKIVVYNANDATAEVPELEGLLLAQVAFGWFLQTESPAVEEYSAALKRYAPNLLKGKNGGWATNGWTAGKLLEFAAQNVSDQPASKEILEGLWRARGERLGGLTPPLTFDQDQPTPDVYCYYPATLKGGKFIADNGLEPICR